MSWIIAFHYWLAGLNEGLSFLIVLTINAAALAVVVWGWRQAVKWGRKIIHATAPKHWKDERK